MHPEVYECFFDVVGIVGEGEEKDDGEKLQWFDVVQVADQDDGLEAVDCYPEHRARVVEVDPLPEHQHGEIVLGHQAVGDGAGDSPDGKPVWWFLVEKHQ